MPVTYLFVPADRPDRFARALASGADRAVIDLEDAVRPDAKAAARDALATADLDWRRVVVRVNAPGSPFWADDVAAVARTRAAAVMVPKAEDPSDLAALDREAIPQVETAQGLDRLDALLGAPGVRRVAMGHLDLALDLGCAPGHEPLLLARQTLVWRSRVAGRDAPVDSVTPEIDAEAVARDAAHARALGFGGKLLIHPAQVAPARAAFAPDARELAWARRVLAAEGAPGARTLDGRMIDRPVEDAARRILAAGEG